MIFKVVFEFRSRIKNDSVKISKFRSPTFLGMVILHILMHFCGNWTKTLGQVRKNMQNRPILTSKLTFVTLTLVGRQKTYCPDAPLFPTSMSWKFREDWTMARGSKGCDGRTSKERLLNFFRCINIGWLVSLTDSGKEKFYALKFQQYDLASHNRDFNWKLCAVCEK